MRPMVRVALLELVRMIAEIVMLVVMLVVMFGRDGNVRGLVGLVLFG